MKQCSKCKEIKELVEFAKDKQKKDGLCSSCKMCKKSYDNIYVEQNRNVKYASNLKYNQEHRKEKQEYDRIRRLNQRDTINEKKRKYYHSEEGKKVHRIWQISNMKKLTDSKKNTKHKRREIIKLSKISGLEFNTWILEQKKICSYCKCNCENNYHVDHIVPLSKGGKHELVNLTIACVSCNTSKGNKNIDEWMALKNISIENKRE